VSQEFFIHPQEERMPMKKKLLVFLSMLTFVLATTPVFFDIYRSAAFNTTPQSAYPGFLLVLIRHLDPVTHIGSPYVYRIISVAVAIPFYYILPTYRFSLLPASVTASNLKAFEAISFVSYVSLLLTTAAIYVIARKQFHASRAASVIVALLVFFVSDFTSLVGIDPFVILIISLLILWLDKPFVFAPFILVSIGINEKIPVLFATVLVFRFLISILRRQKFKQYVQLGFSWLAVAAYFVMLLLFKIPGHEEQLTPALYLANVQSTFLCTLSLRGVITNVIPTLVVAALALFAVRSRQQSGFYVSDISGLVVIVALAFLAKLDCTVGHIVPYVYPLFLPAAACFFDDILKVADKTADASQP
jgi:hypothetical protein